MNALMAIATKARSRLGGPALLLAAMGSLSGCVSVGLGADGEPVTSLLTLTPTATAPVGSAAIAGDGAGALAVLTPEVPAKLDVLRVPVKVSATQVAYVQQAVWVEKPASLFRRLLGETLRAKMGEKEGSVLILDSDDTPVKASAYLRGTLREMSYDAPTSAVVVSFDAIQSDAQGNATSRRFEARESGVAPDAASIGPALNRVANTVAGDVAEWISK